MKIKFFLYTCVVISLLAGCSTTTTLDELIEFDKGDVDSIEIWELDANERIEVEDSETKEELFDHFSNMTLKKTKQVAGIEADKIYIIYLREPRIEFTIYSNYTASVNLEDYIVEDFDMKILESFFR
ncbi:hypothetical protein M3689_02275 [Alkalihalophilus marmarensis]|uniref:Uncharacterized protein n=1 Tax=Alkalihalophilus marmarensis DSM 21297 TaxID=1188261 RepID=U6SRQ2_9BACI|nr:hypothetical protein [Alkalihalophilus marmarensis]ERN54052.1 hypothetical protein A33I_08765 [Alkalihalophilus marmarensis DSM 21297]MCM3488129.1 hypothetical protein [Alkalihalophilus marmarensis]